MPGLATMTIIGIAVLAALTFIFLRVRRTDMIGALMEKRRAGSKLVSRADYVEGVETISARFHERRQRRSGFERAVLRLTGMDLKLEQYARGERFVRAIAEARGRPALARIWDGPESLPSAEEISEPERWMSRVLV